ncbi:probable inactive poly [ADP-ribose] polymerase SRO2 isoform X1 [Musa acuminata AAA Group]|uniref:probable inactive poly [ADP-ribose] polymerase SRO2 isoform X1 n=2 Tax=Musa acuminata AAA Group TaxID=214697 RepID=UPI0031DF0392
MGVIRRISSLDPKQGLGMAARFGKQQEEKLLASNNGEGGGGGLVSGTPQAFDGNGMVRVSKDSEEFILLRHRFYSSIGSLVPHCSLVDLHRVLYSTPTRRTRWEAFHRSLEAVAQKHDGNANDKFAFAEASKDRIIQIVNDGFDVSGTPEDGGYFGLGLYVTPEPVAINSVMSSVVDRDGLRHVMLCRVILGRTEEVVRGSGQSQPGSVDFDSGVDDMKFPTRYVVWYPEVNSRVLPLYVLSIKVDFRSRGLRQEPISRPTSPWISIRNLICVLSKCLPRSTMCQIKKTHCEFMERKFSRQQLVSRIRQVAGDKILLAAIRSFRAKRAAAASLASRRRD